jgi:GTP diphosphokinase / guanosine-3',5'-bis(diphosphate) 3'-diphosphatase
MITRAYEFSKFAHAGQKRHSGEDFIVTLPGGHGDPGRAAPGLGDAGERSDPRRRGGHLATLEDVQGAFGDEVARVVDGLTKIARVQFRTNTEQQVENYRKLLLSMAQDARVILIKLADRLHNMRTLEHLREEKRRRIAQETREIYAPLAHRLGMATIKWELEDLASSSSSPTPTASSPGRSPRSAVSGRTSSSGCEPRWRRTCGGGDRLRGDRPAEAPLVHPSQDGEARQAVRGDLRPHGRPRDRRDGHRLLPRARHHPQQVDARLQERFHDYIATPKSNLYRSLHTTIFGPGGRLYEIQIRTREMHRTAEYGIAAHWKYKEGSRSAARSTRRSPGSARCSSGSRRPASRRSSWSSSASTSSRTRSSSSRRRAT